MKYFKKMIMELDRSAKLLGEMMYAPHVSPQEYERQEQEHELKLKIILGEEMKGFELYILENDKFSLLSGTNRLKLIEEIENNAHPMENIEDQLAKLPPQSIIACCDMLPGKLAEKIKQMGHTIV